MKYRAHKSFDIFHSYSNYLPGWRGMAVLLLLLLAGSLIGNAITYLISMCAPYEFTQKYSILISYPVMFIPAMIYAAAQSHRAEGFDNPGVSLDRNVFAPAKDLIFALAATAGTICTAVIADPIVSLLPDMPKWIEETLKMLTDGPLWVSLLATAVMAPFFEEWLCRGIVLRGMLQHTKPLNAILISAAFFAVIHLNPWQAIPAFLLGCLFGLFYYKTGSLKLTMLMHCVNNAFSVILSRTEAFNDGECLWEVTGKTTFGIIFSICLLAIILLCRWLVGLNSPFQCDADTTPRD